MFKEVSNNVYDHQFSDHGLGPEYCGAAVDDAVFGSDEFRMYAYKIRRCPRMRSHDWTECPYAHRGEKAQRRDPRRHAYAAVVCPAFRAGASCDRGDSCEFAHGVFEYWLHPSRYRTRACNSGRLCHRKVCFFAHSPDQLRRPDPRAAKLRRSGSAHYAYRARVTVTPTAAASATKGDGADVAAGAVKITDKSNSGDEDYSFEKFSEFLRSLRALKIGGDYHDHDGNDGDDDDDGRGGGDGMVRPVVMMSSGLDVSTESDFDSTHVEWISELVK